MKPTIVLIHGAFAESSSWNGVIDTLTGTGHSVIAAAIPLRDPVADAASVGDLVRSVEGPVLLVAHSYGGAVMSNVPADAGEITGLVLRERVRPEPGESCFALAGMFPGSMLGEATLRPVARSDGTTDLYIVQDRFHELFCPDVPAAQAMLLARTQRPATQEALFAPSGERPLWRELPSWFVIGDEDRIIPAELQRFMAKRAGSQRTVEIPGASHALPVSTAAGGRRRDPGGDGGSCSRLTTTTEELKMETSLLEFLNSTADVPELVGFSTGKDDASALTRPPPTRLS